MLTIDQLAALEESWRSANAPIAASLRPGVSVDEIHSAFDEFPAISIPRELELWWGWHNGADPLHGGDLIGGDNVFCSVEQAVANYRSDFDILEEEDEHFLRWIQSGRPFANIACTPGSPDVGEIWINSFGEGFQLVLPSLGELVDVWTDAVDCGLYRYNLTGPFPTDVAVDRLADDDVVRHSLL